MLREGMFIADRYEILEKIGSGGMADVYKAICHKLNRYVAIKVLKPEFCEDKTFVAKFRAEAQSAAGLVHSNIVSIYDTGEEMVGNTSYVSLDQIADPGFFPPSRNVTKLVRISCTFIWPSASFPISLHVPCELPSCQRLYHSLIE